MIAIVLFFLSGIALLLLLSYNFFTRVTLEQFEVNFMRQKNLYAIHILRILESPDYQFLSRKSRRYRDYLFVSYARNLNMDINEMAQSPLAGSAYFYYVLFKILYYLLLIKNKIYSSAQDLSLLMGVELMVVKKLAD